MTRLTKPVRRVSSAHRYEKSKHRAIVLSLEAPAMIGVRLAGTRQTYRLDAEIVYEAAVRAFEVRVLKVATVIAKAEKISLRFAKSRARRQLQAELKP